MLKGIWNKPPLYLKVLLFLCHKADEQGRIFLTTKEIAEGVSWIKNQQKIIPSAKKIEDILKYLESKKLISKSTKKSAKIALGQNLGQRTSRSTQGIAGNLGQNLGHKNTNNYHTKTPPKLPANAHGQRILRGLSASINEDSNNSTVKIKERKNQRKKIRYYYIYSPKLHTKRIIKLHRKIYFLFFASFFSFKMSLSTENISQEIMRRPMEVSGKPSTSSERPLSDAQHQPPFDRERTPYKEIIDYMNQVCGTHYKHTTKATQRLIKARWKEGFTLEDFKKVINLKFSEWGNDPKMRIYLRPQTLFSSKFESYLQQARFENKKSPDENIPPESFCFVYKTMCDMYNIPWDEQCRNQFDELGRKKPGCNEFFRKKAPTVFINQTPDDSPQPWRGPNVL